jgi:hypothetical protein
MDAAAQPLRRPGVARSICASARRRIKPVRVERALLSSLAAGGSKPRPDDDYEQEDTVKVSQMGIASGFVALLVIAGARAAGSSAPAPGLPAPEHLTPELQAEVKARMARHGEVMSNLVRSVILLDRKNTRVLATRIADEEVIARVGSEGASKRPPPLPRDFFAAQDELSQSARQLAGAAMAGGDDKILAERFAAVTRTCVTCHSAYLHGRPTSEPPHAK